MHKQRTILILAACSLLALAGAAWAQMEESEDTQATAGTLSIEQAKLGLEIIDRELVDEMDEFYLNDKVYLWMRVIGGPSDPITVTWSWEELEFPVELNVGSASWRTWSRKTVFKPGEWTVTVTDADGSQLVQHTINVVGEVRPEGSAGR